MTDILIIQGHPDPRGGHFADALAQAYARGARAGGHSVTVLTLATLDFPLLRSQAEQEHGAVPPAIGEAQQAIARAGHILLIFPLWLGTMPALAKAFFEQALRPGFAYRNDMRPVSCGLLKGRSLRIVMTMGMPGLWYRFVYGSHSLKALKIGMFGFVGIRPIRATIIGQVATQDKRAHQRWLDKMERLGRTAA